MNTAELEMYGKIPPQAIEVEEAILGALMLERDAYSNVSGIIDTQSFYKEEHQKIFEAIKQLSKKGSPIDLITVSQEIKNRNQLEEIGGPGYITQLTRRVASAAHIEAHARIIAQKHIQRKMISRASDMLKMAYDDTEDVEDLSILWRKYGEELEDVFTVADTGTSFKTVLQNTLKEIEVDCSRANENKTPGIPTGFVSLDVNTGGWRGGNLIVLAARPGHGKTSFALHFAMVAAKAGYWVNIFSLEMLKTDLARIILASESGIYRSNIRDGYLQKSDWQGLNSTISKIQDLPIIFKDASGMTVNQIQSAIRKNRKNKRCDFVFVDYLQLVKSQQSKQSRELEVSEISRTLKTTALTENIPILALSQFNRDADKETPKLSHLRESGAIEQDADLVCFLQKVEKTQIRFIVEKHRRGQTGNIDIYCNSEMTRFSETQFHQENSVNPDQYIESIKEPF
jgi:replicative DNA helicase